MLVGEIVQYVEDGVVLSAEGRHARTPAGGQATVGCQTTLSVVRSTDRHQAQAPGHVRLLAREVSVNIQTRDGI